MSKLWAACACVGAMLLLTVAAAAQDLSVHVVIDGTSTAVVEGHFKSEVAALSFTDAYAGSRDLAARVSGIKLAGEDKKDLTYKRLRSGEYVAERGFTWFTYRVAFGREPSPNVSWRSDTAAMLALDDFVPQPTAGLRVRVTLDLPPSWRFITNEDRVDENVVDIHNAARAVIFAGSDIRTAPVGTSGARLVMLGGSIVDAPIAAADADAIYLRYVQILGSEPGGPKPQIVVVKDANSSPGTWSAETRGSTVTIVTGGGFSAADERRRLHQQLRHELMHLWIPNALNLSGDYAWFYEGFATYEEQKLGVEMNEIRFDDLLATLSRAYDIYRLTTPQRPLVEISERRWTGAGAELYARGMLAAFVTDVAMLDASKGKISANLLLKQVFDKYRSSVQPANARDAILAVYSERPELRGLVNDLVLGSGLHDWTPYLQKAGLEASVAGGSAQVSVIKSPSARQKVVLDKLGYNSWRKLASK